MGISSRVAKFLMKKRTDYNFSGNLLTLGRSEIFVRKNEIQNLRTSGLKSLNGDAYPAQEDFFLSLGFETCDSLDYSAHDNPTIVQNINEPIPDSLCNRFDFIIDAGTLEHCFNVAEFTKSIVRMLRPGGSIIHINPSNNRTNHGFFQFQPTFYFSFYGANQFAEMDCHYLELPKGYADDDLKAPGRVVPVKNHNNLDYVSEHPSEIIFKATKTQNTEPVVQPIQEFYYRIFKEKAKVNGGLIELDLYQQIRGDVPENKFDRIMAASYWL
jgi:SAM-dependent methyltransferase